MSNTIGKKVKLTLFGESHGEYIGGTLDGITAGVKTDTALIELLLSKRRPNGKDSTSRIEKDEYKIISGIKNGVTTGAPITVIIPNKNVNDADYDYLYGKARPGHCDYSAFIKYGGHNDGVGGGQFSGRLTAPVVALGAICLSVLKSCKIEIGTHIKSLYKISDRDFDDIKSDIKTLEKSDFPTLDAEIGKQMKEEIEKAKLSLDSIGGIAESVITGVPAGIGEPLFENAEALISSALFSIPAVKGVEFGAGNKFAEMLGSEANDPFLIKDGKIITLTNNNGGINGGITNGMPIILRTAVKPTPSIAKEQQTVDFIKNENITLSVKGRHDPAIVHRAVPVIDAYLAIVICDMLSLSYGDNFTEKFK